MLTSTVLSVALFLSSHAVGAWAQTALALDGSRVDPWSASGSKVVVLIFVRTDCPISNRYAPTIEQLKESYGKRVAFWLVYVDARVTAKDIRRHEREYRLTLAALRDPQHALVKRSQVRITPEAAVFTVEHALAYHGRIDNLYEDIGKSRPAATSHELADAIENTLRGVAAKMPAGSAVGCYISDVE